MTIKKIIRLWNETRNKKLFKKLLLAAGFSILGFGLRSIVFSKRKLDFVVKVSDGVVTRKFKQPDLERYRLKYIYTNGNRNIAIQKKASCRTKASRYRAWAKIRDSVNANLEEFDIHQDNVGWLNGTPVIFDYT